MLNEVVIDRGAFPGPAVLDVFVDRNYVTTGGADIVGTPSVWTVWALPPSVWTALLLFMYPPLFEALHSSRYVHPDLYIMSYPWSFVSGLIPILPEHSFSNYQPMLPSTFVPNGLPSFSEPLSY